MREEMRVERVCLECGLRKERRRDMMYCSARCRNRAWCRVNRRRKVR